MAQKKNQSLLSHYIFILAAFLMFFMGSGITSFVTAGSVQTSDAGTASIDNPSYGAVKGTLQFVIKDGDAIISADAGANHRIYFAPDDITLGDYNLIKPLSDTGFSGTLTGVDADSGTVCSPSSYTTEMMYYDENSDGTRQPDEKEVYSVVADSNGCFAAKVKAGAWDMYG